MAHAFTFLPHHYLSPVKSPRKEEEEEDVFCGAKGWAERDGGKKPERRHIPDKHN